MDTTAMATEGAATTRAGRRIVLATFGSLGDLHPFIAVAKGLQARGHDVVVSTSECHRERVERQGIGFEPARPDLKDIESDPEVFRILMDAKKGSEFVIRQIFMRHLGDSYEDLLRVAKGA